jgi:hypothetical protein
VTCTERGRWSYDSREFSDSDLIMPGNLRTKKTHHVAESLHRNRSYDTNQQAVWSEIDKMCTRSGVRSATGAMRDVVESKKADLDDYLDFFKCMPLQKGLIVLANGKVAGLDFVSSESAYAVLHSKLIKSYAMDVLLNTPRDTENKSTTKSAAESKTEKRAENRDAEDAKDVKKSEGFSVIDETLDHAKKFIEDVKCCKESRFESVGYGWDFRFEGPTAIGSALVSHDTVIHMAFFGVTGIDENMRRTNRENNRMAGFNRRRGFR